MEFGFEVIEAKIGPEWKPWVLDFAPEDFDEVQFRAVGRQPVQSDALAEPVECTRLKGAAGVNGGVVEDDAPEFFGVGGEGIQYGHDGRRGDRTGHVLKVALVCGTDQAEDIQPGAGSARDSKGLTTGFPGIRDDGRERETALIKVKQFDHPLGVALSKVFSSGCGPRERPPRREGLGPDVSTVSSRRLFFDHPSHRLAAGRLPRRLGQSSLRLSKLPRCFIQPLAEASRFSRRVDRRASRTRLIVQAPQTRSLPPVQPRADRVYLHLKQRRQGDAPIPPMRQIHRLRPLPNPAVRPVLPRRPQRVARRFA